MPVPSIDPEVSISSSNLQQPAAVEELSSAVRLVRWCEELGVSP